MKKIILLFFISAMSVLAYSQDVIVDVTDEYYPVNPFVDKFSEFLKGLINNPFLSEKSIHKRTDSTLFFFKGKYGLQNPFSFQPSKIEVILAESEMELSDSASLKDTILVYQLIAYSEKSLQTVKTEFNRFEREFGKRFSNSTNSDIVSEGKVEGSTHNYFLKMSRLSPLSFSWGKMSSNEYACIITIRFIVKQNEALMPLVY
ncbi:MAG: hypothetical protein JNL23_08780 [Chitinophagaceae bacterium]|nr:hypothetical protein [Chitinophagaceae bacterium]